jgi:hypothetical protein
LSLHPAHHPKQVVIDREIAFAGSITSKPGTCEIQVLRSAPLNLRRAEWRALPKGTEGRENHPKNANLFFTPTTAQNDIHHAIPQCQTSCRL